MTFLQYIAEEYEGLRYDTVDITPDHNPDALVKYGLWDYKRVNGKETIPCTFSDGGPEERLQLSDEEAEIIVGMYDAFIDHNHRVSQDIKSYEPIYSEWAIPFITKDKKFKPSSMEPAYSIKFIEELDRYHPDFVSKLLARGFAEPLDQTKESIKGLEHWEDYYNTNLEGKVTVSKYNNVVDEDDDGR